MFLNAAFLIGISAIAVPIVIHLIHRQRYPDRAFPTLRFFDKTIKHNVIQRRLIDRLLLLLRVVALICLALGLSRPFWHGSVGERRTSLVILLDNSPSMARRHDGKPLLDQAKATVAGMLDRLGPGDRAEILLTSGTAPSAPASGKRLAQELVLRDGEPTAMLVSGPKGAALSVPGMTSDAARLQSAARAIPDGTPVTLASYSGGSAAEFGYDHGRLRALLDSVAVSSIPGNMQAAVSSAAEMLSRSGDGDRRVVIVSDLQAADWRGEPTSGLAGIDVNVVSIEPDPAVGPNLAIDDCTVSRPLAGLGQEVAASVTLHNYGSQASGQSTLRVVADAGVPIDTKIPAIPPRASLLVAVPMRASGHDHMLCSATIVNATDPFAYDNTWYFQIGVRPPVTALCVNGAVGATGADKSTFFVMNALATRGGGSAPSADARECETEELKNQKLFQYGVVLLADVTSLDADARQKLRQFVSDGGGLLIFANPNAAASEYNGWDFLPARVTGQKKAFQYVRSMAEKATAVADVRRRAGSTVSALTSNESLALEPAENATVLARFSDGLPALVEGRVGKGRVILAAASCHVSRSDWPLQPAFVLLVRELVQNLGANNASAAIGSRQIVGDGAAMAISAEHGGGTPELFRVATQAGDGSYQALAWYRRNDRLVMPEAAESGQYLLAVRPDPAPGLLAEPGLGADIVPVSVNHDARESDLTPATAGSIEKQLPGARVSLETATAAGVIDIGSGRDLWRWLVTGALIFLLCEGVIAWRWASESS
ncbi:MAG TPA: BatA domain-containing protein [Tepidisphaeraceae bacterium]|jgi:hypothetical protein|nr:BatA domain-containing protein [Tepidisphaeraceae bacterium]